MSRYPPYPSHRRAVRVIRKGPGFETARTATFGTIISCYNRSGMRNRPVARALVVLLCVALALSLLLGPSGSQLHWAVVVPILTAFAFPSVRRRVSRAVSVPLQPISFISFDGSRAPPLN
jgi:hypothetical protein